MSDRKLDIENIFGRFHDGFIEEAHIHGDEIKLKAGIRYLAELIHPSFDYSSSL